MMAAQGSPRARVRLFQPTGVMFPLHIVLGLCAWPLMAVAVACGSTAALIALLVYLPFFLWPAQSKVS